MTDALYTTTLLRDHVDALAPDGAEVRLLVDLPRGSMAHFTLPAGKVSRAIRHRTIEELWYVVSGKGEMWRAQGEEEDVVTLQPGVALTIPTGCAFQFRATDGGPLSAVGVAMPPWPGEHEAAPAKGPWEPTA